MAAIVTAVRDGALIGQANRDIVPEQARRL